MIDHERARELASMTPEQGLDPTDREWLSRHLDACDDCRTFVHSAAPMQGAVDPTNDGSADLERAVVDESELGADVRAARPPGGVRRPGREWIRGRGAVLVGAALIVALVAGTMAWNASKPSELAVAESSSSPLGSSPTAPAADPWASLDPSGGFPADNTTGIATLAATAGSGPIVALDTGFRLTSARATSASRLASRLSVDPSFAFTVKPDAGDRAAVIVPSAPLLAGIVYRFDLHGATGELLDTWAFQATQPLRVVGTLPDDQATDVPTDTGIEITFDQDGVTDAESHVAIAPATNGRFEEHGRVLAFVPDRLLPATIYTVTVSRGVKVGGTGEATVADVRFQFETAAKDASSNPTTFEFQDQLVESATADRPVISLWTFGDDQKPPSKLRVEVYRFADMAAAIGGYQALQAQPSWARWSTAGLVPTARLRRVVSTDARLNTKDNILWLQLPERLPAGWYVVQQNSGTRPTQMILQVTDVSGYLAVSGTKTLVWANDVKTGGPIVGAIVAAAGVKLGRTDARGLLVAATPAAIQPIPSQGCHQACSPVVTIQTANGRSAFLPARTSPDKYENYGLYRGFGDSDAQYWSLFHTDRNRYRPTDAVNSWGVLRNRDNGAVPAIVTVRLMAETFDSTVQPPVASVAVHPGPAGAFLATLPLASLPEGNYSVDLLVGNRVVRSNGIVVGPLSKPAYQLQVETGRHIYLAGDRIRITARASFFEGTPVPGVPLRIDGYVEHGVTTDATGTAVYHTTARSSQDNEGPEYDAVQVAPARPEEAEIGSASNDIVVFPSSRTVNAVSVISRGRVRVSGTVNLVDVARLEREVVAGRSIWDLDPRGSAVRGAIVTVRFVELVPVRTSTGTEYDFIEKKVVPTYDTRIVERAVGTVTVKSGVNGAYSASIPASSAGHDYQVVVSVADAGGHIARITSQATLHPWTSYQTAEPTLAPTGPAAIAPTSYGIGDRVDVRMTDPGIKQAAGDGTRYLFFVAQRGLRSATVQSSSRFATTFARWAAPNFQIGAVRFTGHGYVGTATFDAQFRVADRRLQVDLSTGASRYRPGDLATVKVRTRDSAGHPVAATVVLRAIDQKLYSIGAADQVDPLSDLYSGLSSGIVSTYASHRNPRSRFEGGDTTGGGGDDRNDFRDSLLFESISTDASGRGSVSFRLSDDLTSWRVSAAGITSRLDAGASSVLVPVGLPFFVDGTIAPEYLLSDRPTIELRAFGSALPSGANVRFEVTSSSLGFRSPVLVGKAFGSVGVALPALRLGSQTITVTATTGSGASTRRDKLTRTFNVVATRLTRSRSAYAQLPLSGQLTGGDGFTTILISDASGGRYLSLLTDLASGGGARLDRGLAAALATSLLKDRFGSSAEQPIEDFQAQRYQAADGGLALLPYASSDVELSAMVAIAAPNRVDAIQLGNYLRSILTGKDETRERQMFALAGLAGLGSSVLPAIRAAAADPNLTTREQLMIGIGAAALGDAATARTIAAALIAAHGERLGEQARLRVGSVAADTTHATALMAVLAAAIGEPQADAFWAYVEANPESEALNVLPAAAYIAARLSRLPVTPARFASTVDRVRRVIDLDTVRSFELKLTGAQLKTLSLERLAGAVGVTTIWREPVAASVFEADPDVTMTRTVTPSGAVGTSDLVRVDINVTFGPQAPTGCLQVTELVPSGLAPVGSVATWVDPNSEQAPADPGVVLPYDQSGSRVFFCVETSPQRQVFDLRYYARVVTPGTYTWEPAIGQSLSQAGRAALTAPTTILIR